MDMLTAINLTVLSALMIGWLLMSINPALLDGNFIYVPFLLLRNPALRRLAEALKTRQPYATIAEYYPYHFLRLIKCQANSLRKNLTAGDSQLALDIVLTDQLLPLYISYARDTYVLEFARLRQLVIQTLFQLDAQTAANFAYPSLELEAHEFLVSLYPDLLEDYHQAYVSLVISSRLNFFS